MNFEDKINIKNKMEKVRQTCIEIFQQRGYTDIDTKEETLIKAVKPNKELICAFLLNTPKFNNEKAQSYIGMMNSMDIKHSLIIYKDLVTSSAKKIEQNLKSMRLELFSEDELQYNITKHILQPIFERLSDTDAIEFKKQYGSKFPTILRSDPIARFYGYQRGDVIKVIRKNGYITYRIVKG
jgi:DNA-directed RNA polymerase I, II, and III subunit RPABC1